MRKLLLLFALLPGTLLGAWLEWVPQIIEQPDGEVIECFATGDEFYRWLHDADGYTIVLNPADGYFYYGTRQGEEVIPTRHKVGRINPARAGLNPWARISTRLYQERRAEFQSTMKSTTGTPKHGVVNSICVYISFADDSVFVKPRSGYVEKWGAIDQLSVRNYYLETSYNTLDLRCHHFPVSPDTINISYVDIYPRAYYLPWTSTNTQGYLSNQKGQREHAMLKRAVEFIDSQIPDTLVVDGNDDGLVDNISFVIRGSSSAWSDLLWPHAWSMGSGYNAYLQGARVANYFLVLETSFNLGTTCHELGHVFGAPDLYHYDDTGAPEAVGDWCLMNASNNPPQGICGFLRWKYNEWIPEIPEITESGTYTLLPLSNPERNIFKIRSPLSSSEYFVLEYRNKAGDYEISLPSSGLLVYRINPGAGRGNASGPPDEVYLYRPGGSLTVEGSLGSAALGISSRTAISDYTNPYAFLWNNGDGGPGGLDISDITIHGDSLTFKVAITPHYPPSYLSYTLTDTYVNLAWRGSSMPGVTHYVVYRDGEEYATTPQTVYRDIGVESGATHKYQVAARYGSQNPGESERSNEVIVTKLGVLSLPYAEDFEQMNHGWVFKNNTEGFRWGNAEELGLLSDNETKFLNANSAAATMSSHVTDYAISPRLNLEGLSQVELRFDYALKRMQQNERLFLVYRRTPTEAWKNWVELPPSGIGAAYKWRNYAIELPSEAISGSTQVALLYDDGRAFGYGSAIDNVEVADMLSGIDQPSTISNVELYPNPSHGMAFIRLYSESPLTIRLIDQAGRSLQTKHYEYPLELTETLDLMRYPDGTYFVVIETIDKVIIRQLIKTR